MKRYSNIEIKHRWDGKRVYNTTHYPEIPVSDNDIYIVSNDTDYLDTLSFKYYKDPTLWWIIALANNIGKGRMSVEGGIQLRIPTDIQNILSEYDRLNS
jgi:nucleoid-associated protein YgaU